MRGTYIYTYISIDILIYINILIYIDICLETVCPGLGFQLQVRIKSAAQPETQKHPQMVVFLI